MDKLIYILNGPNLNLLGEREPHLYGHVTLAEVKEICVKRAATHGCNVDFRQTNFEGVLIESIHEARKNGAGIIINPAGLTFTSVALMDALKMFDGPKIEFHITNVHQREEIYHKSLVSRAVTAVMAGLGPRGYEIAVDAMATLLTKG